jgi:hypothetical protein
MASTTDDEDLRRRLDVEKLSAEVSKMIAETVRLSQAQRESGPRFQAEVEKMNAEAAKARAEAQKLSRERGWFPYVTVTTSLITLATVVFTAYKLLHP